MCFTVSPLGVIFCFRVSFAIETQTLLLQQLVVDHLKFVVKFALFEETARICRHLRKQELFGTAL